MQYDDNGPTPEWESISPSEDEIEDALREHPDWSDEQVAAALAGHSVSVADVAQVRRWA